MKKKVHIVSFDNPYPANYGGAIDVYYKVKALFSIGVEIYLHCFAEQQETIEALERYCKQVYWYPKKKSPILFLSTTPYRAKIRDHNKLVERLIEIPAPILFEGLHTTEVLKHSELQKQKTIVRAHNIEHDYSYGLSKSTSNWFWKAVHYIEALRFKQYEKRLKRVDHILSLSNFEYTYFKKHYQHAIDIPVFHANATVAELSPKGNYALYQGDLSISDNIRAVEFLIDVFKEIDYPLIIASGTKPLSLSKQIEKYATIQFVQIESDEHLNQLLNEAHINVMMSYQRSGTKLKLINALYQSRFCIVNENISDEPKVLALCKIANTQEAFKQAVHDYIDKDYKDTELRKEILPSIYGTELNAKKIKKLL